MSEQKMIRLDVNHMMADFLGAAHGIDPAAVTAMAPKAADAYKAFEAVRGTGMTGWANLPTMAEAEIARIEQVADGVRKQFDAFVVLGIGGSALGPIAVQQALNHLRYNELPAEKRNGPKLYVEDNVDPERMASLLDIIDIKKTCFNVITKSGKTAETMSQYLIIADLLQKAGVSDWTKHIIATTDPKEGNLIKIAAQFGFETFFIPASVGGRFSELSPVGLLACAVCGINIREMLAGARLMDEACKSGDVWKNPALLEATLQVLAMEKGMNIQVVLPYADSLKSMADWFCQLWAESLGKNVTRDGKAVNVGQTPVKALGVTDQHSQLQLYTEGPFDKVITFLHVEDFRAETTVPEDPKGDYKDYVDVAFLGGLTHSRLIDAERQGTEYALYAAGRMNQTITLPSVNPNTIGQLLFFFELVTAYTGELLNINAYNQPGVEESKIATYVVLERPGDAYDAKRKEMEARPARKDAYLL